MVGVAPKREATYANSKHLDEINAPEAWKTTMGEGVRIALLDSGVCYYHPDLKDNVEAFYDMTNTTIEDETGHGSHCAGIMIAAHNTDGVTGVAPEAKIISFKVIGQKNEGTIDAVNLALRRAIDMNVDIINMSLGLVRHPGAEMELLIKEAHEKGIIMVAASGNQNSRVLYPARFDEVIAVSGIDEMEHRAKFSNYGVENEVCAPSVKIASTYKNGMYALLSGTSMAAPMISAACALYISAEGYHPKNSNRLKTLMVDLRASTKDLGSMGKDDYYGWGMIDIRHFVAKGVERKVRFYQNYV